MSMKDFINTLSDEQKKALFDALNDDNSTVSHFVPEEVNKEVKTFITEDFRVHRNLPPELSKRREPVKAKENIWTDNGEARNIETPNVNRTPRTRKPPQKKDVKCSVCGKINKVHASLIYGQYYRCDNCTG